MTRGARVAQVAYGATISGGERVMLDVVDGLVARGDAVLGVVATPGPVADALRAAGAEVAVLDVNKTYDLAGARRLARLLRDFGAEVVETHGFLRNVHGRLARALFGGPPHVGVVHRALGWRSRWHELPARERWRIRYYEACERWTAGASATTIAVSAAVRDDLVAGGRAPRGITVVPNGIPDLAGPAGDPAEVRGALGVPAGARLLVTLARLSPLKDVATMVRAVAAAPGWHLRVAGAGPEEGRLRDLVEELGAGERVRLLGRREDGPALLAAADAFGLSSVAGEGLPIALLEAMRAGRPAVVTDEPGTLAAASRDETALVVPPADPGAFAAALVRLGDDPALAARLGAAARAAYEARFTAARMVAGHLAALDAARGLGSAS